MKKQLTTALIAGLLVSTGAFADQALSDSRGDVIKDNYGDCVMTLDGLNSCVEAVHTAISLSGDAHFDFNKSTLKPAGIAKLDQLYIDLKNAVKVESIRLSGHTDSVGSEKYNQGLSERRAHSVEKYLLDKGVSSSIITSAGFGKMNPIADNATAAGRAQNRRVEIGITATSFKSSK